MKVKITVEIDGETSVIEAEHVTYVAERGYKTRYDKDGSPEYKHNGHQRISIQAWSGCETFESFQATSPDNGD